MADISPISLRFVLPEWTAEAPSPPHDALSVEERRRHLAEHPYSYLGVTRAPEDAAEVGGAAAALREGRRSLEAMLEAGVFGPDQPQCFYLYRLELGDHRQTGLLCGVATDDYDRGAVRIHENIDQLRAQHLAHHLGVVGAQSSPIAMAFDSTPAVSEVIERTVEEREPFLDFRDETGLRQQLWTVDPGGDAGMVRAALADVPLYLIDGHHRAAAASTHLHHRRPDDEYRTDRMLCVLFPAGELRNKAFHRVIRGVDLDRLRRDLQDNFACRESDDPTEVAERADSELALLHRSVNGSTADGWSWLLIDVPFRTDEPGPLDNIDQTRLGRDILEPLLGIIEGRSDGRLSYRPGSSKPGKAQRMTLADDEAMFIMRAVPVSTVMAASDQGQVMPPKSTYFEPKVRSGVFVRLL